MVTGRPMNSEHPKKAMPEFAMKTSRTETRLVCITPQILIYGSGRAADRVRKVTHFSIFLNFVILFHGNV